ncbi:hypothetical protein [Sinorhizobium arboris]|uniref:hypothetical protein n=1 Tax=Sinorhizobium arboris TaxID=76745 RepID=UPI00124345B1|nr:hypothetical protein [Sinorhizobium arboris]
MNKGRSARGGGGCFGIQIDLRQAVPDKINSISGLALPSSIRRREAASMRLSECSLVVKSTAYVASNPVFCTIRPAQP